MPELAWTKQKPTVPGLYMWKTPLGVRRKVARIYHEGDDSNAPLMVDFDEDSW